MPDPALSLLVTLILIAVIIWLFRPERGRFWAWQRWRQVTSRVRHEDALKHIHRYERHGRPAGVESLAGSLHLKIDETAELVAHMAEGGLVRVTGDTIRLTQEGREVALHVLRAHRLWERHLADRTGFGEAEWHDRADHFEHLLTPDDVDALAAQLGHPTHDPHGDPIPTAAGQIVAHGGQPLTELDVDLPARIVHLEDEPETVYAQLVAEDIHPGAVVRVLENTPKRIRFWANGNEHRLAPIMAANISVVPLAAMSPAQATGERLSTLQLGETAEVLGLSPACRGNERRRFMDLGILPGTAITAEMRGPSGDPTAYRIRDTLIALRQDQADNVQVQRQDAAGTPSEVEALDATD